MKLTTIVSLTVLAGVSNVHASKVVRNQYSYYCPAASTVTATVTEKTTYTSTYVSTITETYTDVEFIDLCPTPTYTYTPTTSYDESTQYAYTTTTITDDCTTVSPNYDTTSTPYYYTPPYDTTSTPSYDTSYYTTSTPGYDTTSTPVYYTTSTPGYDTTSTPAYYTTSTPSYDTSCYTTSTPGYDTTSTPVYYTTSTPAYYNTTKPAYYNTTMKYSVPPPYYTSTSTSSAYSSVVTWHVVVGGPAGLVYTPDHIDAAVGDVVEFEFLQKNHTVTQSDFLTPCVAREGGFKTGFVPNLEGTMPGPIKSLTVMDTKPFWAYCGQKLPIPHCEQGMVFAINAPKHGNTFKKFVQNAKNTVPSS